MTETTSQPVPLKFIILMISMGTVALLSSDMHISAMPNMGEFFNVTKPQIQTTFTIYLIGLCFGQTCFGLLLDKFDTRRVAIISLLVFIAASICCAFANSLALLVTCRFFQAVGASVCSVIYRSIVAARYDKQQVAKILALIFPVAGLAPAIAPFIGGILESIFGWRAIFIFTAFYGVMVLSFVMVSLRDNPEDHIRPMTASDLGNRTRIALIGSVLKNRVFCGYVLVVAMAFAAFRSYTAESPFVFHGMGMTALEIGNFYLPLSIAYFSGNMLTKKLLNRYPVDRLIKLGLQIMVGGGVLMVFLALLDIPRPEIVFLSMSVITFSNGFLIPCGNAAALTSVASRLSGIAAALVGITQLAVASLCVACLSSVARGQFLPLAWMILALSLLGVVTNRALRQPIAREYSREL